MPLAIAGATAGVLGGGASLYNAIKGSSGSSTVKNAPAAMTGDQARINNEFQNSLFGKFDPVYYLKTNPDIVDNWNKNHPKKPITADQIPDDAIAYATKHWNKYGKSEGRNGNDPALTKTYEEKIAEDNAYLKDVDQKLVGDQGGVIDQYKDDYAQTNQQKTDARTAQSQNQANVSGTYIDQIKGDAAKYEGEMGKILSPLAALVGAAPQKVLTYDDGTALYGISGAQAYAQNQTRATNNDLNTNRKSVAGQEYGVNTSLLDLIAGNAVSNAGDTEQMNNVNLGLDTGQNTLENAIDKVYTPNKNANDYQNFMQAENARNDSLRYSTPTQTESASIGSGNILPSIAGMMDIVNNIMKTNRPAQSTPGKQYTYNNLTGAIEEVA